MKNLLWLTLFLTIVACCNTIEKKETACPQYPKGSSEYQIDSARNGLGFEGNMTRGNLYKVVKMEDYDTIYRFYTYGGWGGDNNICSIYRQMDTPQYKVQLLSQKKWTDTIYVVSEKTLTTDEWQYFRKRFDAVNFWCYPIINEGNCIDCTTFSVIAKEKEKKKNINWSMAQHAYDKLRGLGMDMFELADYPMPYARLICLRVKDSIRIDMFPSDFYNTFIKKYEFKSSFKDGTFNQGLYQVTIHKKDVAKLNDIEMVVEFYNGRVRTTTEKKIQGIKFGTSQ